MRGVFENRTNQYFRLFLITSSIIAVMVTLLSAAYRLFVKVQQKSFCSTKKSASIISIRDVCKKWQKRNSSSWSRSYQQLCKSLPYLLPYPPQYLLQRERLHSSEWSTLATKNSASATTPRPSSKRATSAVQRSSGGQKTLQFDIRRSWNFVRDKSLPFQNCLLLFVPGSAPGVQKPIVSFTA